MCVYFLLNGLVNLEGPVNAAGTKWEGYHDVLKPATSTVGAQSR